jgi:hypothetical protein
MGGAGLYEVVLNERADGLCNEAADFIEQSLTPPEGALTLDNASIQRLMDYGLLHHTNRGWIVGEWEDAVKADQSPPEGDTVSGEVVERVARRIQLWWMTQKHEPMHQNDAGDLARAAIAALQSRVSPQAGMREALEAARRALSAVLGFPKGAALSENALDLCEQAFVGIDAALSTAPIPMSEDAK